MYRSIAGVGGVPIFTREKWQELPTSYQPPGTLIEYKIFNNRRAREFRIEHNTTRRYPASQR